MTRRALVGFIAVTLTLAAQDSSLHLVILEGDGAINNIRAPRGKEPVVRVEGAGSRAVAGAVVTFLLPASGGGAGAAFADGEAVARGLHANRIAGSFQIRVSASEGGRTATATISQTNVDPGTRASSHRIALLAILGGAAAGGAALAFRGGKGKATAAAAPSNTVVAPGVPVFGGPE
jgi:hypothetical protein